MKILIHFLIYYLCQFASAKSQLDEIDQDRSFNPFNFGVNGCLFQGCECSTKANSSLSITCDGQIYHEYKVMFPQRKDNKNTEINDFFFMNNNFYSIPPKIFEKLGIKNLIFMNNHFDSIFFDSFAQISSLYSLEFYENNFIEIDQDSFAPLFDKLSRLAFHGNSFTEDATRKIQNSIQYFKNLTFLALDNFNLEDSSEWLKINSKKLSVLDLSNNRLKSLSFFGDSGNSSYKNLAELYLASNIIGPVFRLSDLNGFSNSLEVLFLSRNKIQDLSTDSQIFKKLEKLDLSENMLKFVYRDYFKKMPNLIELNLQKNLIYQIDIDSFHNNLKLSTLILSNNQINYLDSMLTDSLQSLENLFLHSNFLDSMPSILNMTNLKMLDLSNQQVEIFNVPDYSFDRRKSSPKISISLIGFPGLILNFGDKAFCSKGRKEIIDYIELNHYNIPKPSVCLLGQLKNTTIDLFRDSSSKFAYDFSRNKICNCYLINYLNKEGISFGKSCKIDLTECEKSFFQQQDRVDFDIGCETTNQLEC